MANVAVTYSFSAGSVIPSASFNTNYSDVTTWLNNRNQALTDWDAFSCAVGGTFKATSNQLTLGTTRTVTITAPTPATSSRTHTIPDITANGTFAFLEGAQTFTATKTFSGGIAVSGGSITVPGINLGDAGTGFYRNASNNISMANNQGLTMVWSTTDVEVGRDLVPTVDNSKSLGLSGTRWSDVRSVLGTIETLDASTLLKGKGTATNDSAASGYIGESARATVAPASSVSSTGSTQWYDVTSVSLTAGDWDVSAIVGGAINGATATVFAAGISATSGNSSTGLAQGDNYVEGFVPTTTTNNTLVIPSFRVSLSGTTIYYLKANYTFSGGTPKAYGTIRARRVR
jgi:hypothetical protein